MFTTKHKPTPLMKSACEHAEAVLAHAVQSIDNMMGEDEAAIEHPELILGFMTVAGAAYQALSLRDSIEAFLEAQERRAEREKYALTIH